MTHNTFITKYNGKPLEFYDSSNLNQCFDVISAYIVEVLGLKIIPLGVLNAYQLYTAPTKKITDNFTLVPNTPTGVPQTGDIIVWGKTYGVSGHTAVATGKGDTNSFEVFSQNDPLKSVCKIKTYKYAHVLGWLRPKVLPVEQSNMDDKKLADEFRKLTQHNGDYITAEKILTALSVKDKRIGELETVVSIQSANLLKLKEERDDLQDRLKLSQDEVESKEKLRAKWHELYAASQEALKISKDQSKDLQKKLTTCQNESKKELTTFASRLQFLLFG